MFKEVLNWVADHTGISWILGKFSSSWKWLFSSKTDATEDNAKQKLIEKEKQQLAEEHTQEQDLSQTPVDNYFEVENQRLYLKLTPEIFEEHRKKICIYIEYNGKKFAITGINDNENSRISIMFIQEQNNGVPNAQYEEFYINKIVNVEFSHTIKCSSIVMKEDILDIVTRAALKEKVAVNVSSVAKITTPSPSTKLTEELKDTQQKVHVNNNRLRIEGNDLILSLPSENYEKYKNCKHPEDESKVLIYIQYGKNKYRVVGNLGENYEVNISSILKQNTSGQYNNGNIVLIAEGIKHVKKILGWNDEQEVAVNVFDVDQTTTPSTSTKPTEKLNATAPKAYADLVEIAHLRVDGSDLVLSLAKETLEKVQGYKNPYNAEELLIYVQLGKKEYRITGILNKYRVNINSIVEVRDGIVRDNDVLCPANDMKTIKEMLGLSDQKLIVIVDRITNSPAALQTQQNREPDLSNIEEELDFNETGEGLSFVATETTMPSASQQIINDVINGTKELSAPQDLLDIFDASRKDAVVQAAMEGMRETARAAGQEAMRKVALKNQETTEPNSSITQTITTEREQLQSR